MKKEGQIRSLSRIEQAFTVLNETFPLTAIGVLRMEAGPSSGHLRRAIDRLQQVHPVLQVAIHRKGNRYYFQLLEKPPPLTLEVMPRDGTLHWQRVAVEKLNKAFDLSAGPLMRFCYLQETDPSAESELIVAYHHAIGDALSGIHCLHQLLSWCNGKGIKDQEKEKQQSYPFPPAAETLFPKGYRGISRLGKLASFMGRQLREELAFRRANAKATFSAIPDRPENDLIYLAFDPETSRRLISRSRREQVSVAGMLVSAMLMAVWEKRYRKTKGLHRVVIFSNMRPFLEPPLGKEVLGCFNSLLRFSQTVDREMSFWKVARSASRQIYLSGKRSERLLFAFLSKDLVKMNLRQANDRMGTVALSYMGPLELESTYGKTKVLGVHGAVTNNPLGAELSAFGKMIDGRIELDLQYLTAEMDRPAAEDMVRTVEQCLISALGS